MTTIKVIHRNLIEDQHTLQRVRPPKHRTRYSALFLAPTLSMKFNHLTRASTNLNAYPKHLHCTHQPLIYTEHFGRNQFFWLCKEPSSSLTSRMFDFSFSALSLCGKECNSSKQAERVWLRAFSMTVISCRLTLNELAYFINLPFLIFAHTNSFGSGKRVICR